MLENASKVAQNSSTVQLLSTKVILAYPICKSFDEI
jgi:hypothetical protein